MKWQPLRHEYEYSNVTVEEEEEYCIDGRDADIK
jgi:hypothetical protein